MTIEEAIRVLIAIERYPTSIKGKDEACEMAISALRAQQQREQLWHDAKNDPPSQNGLYYGAKDDTNAMWLVQYKDGTWTLDCYPDHPMSIVRWAFYDAFCGDDEQEAEKNEPLTLDELRGMEGQPVWIVAWPDWGHWELSADAEDYLEDRDPDFYGMKYDDPVGRYGLHVSGWLAYRRPPEKEA